MPYLWTGDKMIDGRIVKNFSLTEMMNNEAKDDIKLVLTPEVVEFAQMMQKLRNWYGKPMEVSSWYRTPTFNKQIGGDSYSALLDGRACDIVKIPKDKYDEFITAWQVICKAHGKIGGCNTYTWGMHFTDHEDKFGHKDFIVRKY